MSEQAEPAGNGNGGVAGAPAAGAPRAELARRAATALALSRAAYGATLAVAPAVTAVSWLGPREARRPATRILARAFGARELLVGAGTLHVLRAGTPTARRTVLAALACADAVDLTATVANRHRLAMAPAWLSIAGAAGSVAIGVWSATSA